ncbi:MAG: M14 family zinc carboxypeptidase [Candidatus Coproplasma sp.]
MTVYEEITCFYSHYKKKKCIIGYSFYGRNIYAMHVGKHYGKQFIAVCGTHAREWICSRLALKFIRQGSEVGGWVIPLLNPDGAIICQTQKPLWKANGRGVDLNCNFDADWGTGKLNVKHRGAENCIGDYPLSEPETLALANFTIKVKPYVTLSFHTKGGEIYWEFKGEGDKSGADVIAQYTGYTPKIITGSAGGYKDFCIQKLHIPSYTIECGKDSLTHPIKSIRKIRECNGLLRYFTKHYAP